MTTEQMLKVAVNALSYKKAVDIKVLKIEKLTIVADYFIICNGTSVTQIKALADEVEFRLEQAGTRVLHREGYGSGSWVLLGRRGGDRRRHIIGRIDERARPFMDRGSK